MKQLSPIMVLWANQPAIYCPGCEMMHRIQANDPTDHPKGCKWNWNGDSERPTFHPSLLVHLGEDGRCHSFIRNGQWEFLSDSTHALSGQTVPIPSLPDYILDGL